MSATDFLATLALQPGQADLPEIQRQQAMANALMQQSLTPDQGQMVSGHYIAPAFGGLGRIAEAAIGAKMNRNAMTQRIGFNRALGQMYANVLNGSPMPGQTGTQAPQSTSTIYPTPAAAIGPGVAAGVNIGAAAAQQSPQPVGQPAQPSPQGMSGYAGGSSFMFPNLIRGGVVGDIGGPGAAAAYWKQYEPTDLQRNDMYLGISPDQSRAEELARRNKAGTMSFQPNQMNVLPNGQIVVAPDFSKGTAGGFDAQGRPTMGVINGAPQALYNTGFASAAASENAKGPTSVNTPQGPVLMTPVQQKFYAQTNGALQTPEGQQMANQKATAAVNYEKMKAAADPLLQIIQQARSINNLAPYGPYGMAEGRIALSSLPLANHDAAKYGALWQQQMGQSILNTISNLAASGGIRMDIPIVKEIQKAGGIPLSLPPAARAAMLDQLETEVRQRLAAAGNVPHAIGTYPLAGPPTVPMPAPVQTHTNVVDFGSLK